MNLSDFVKAVRCNTLPESFIDEIRVPFVIDKRACNSLNSVLGTSFRAVYREKAVYKKQWSGKSLSWDAEHVYLVTSDNRVVFMSNSEWACFQEEKC